jgi:hypothetical protein
MCSLLLMSKFVAFYTDFVKVNVLGQIRPICAPVHPLSPPPIPANRLSFLILPTTLIFPQLFVFPQPTRCVSSSFIQLISPSRGGPPLFHVFPIGSGRKFHSDPPVPPRWRRWGTKGTHHDANRTQRDVYQLC